MPHIAAQWEGDLQRSTSWPYTGIHPHKSLLLTSDCRDATDQSWLDWFAHFLRLCREDAGYSVALRENHCLFSAYNVNDEPVVPIVMQWIQWNQYCTNNPGLWLSLSFWVLHIYIWNNLLAIVTSGQRAKVIRPSKCLESWAWKVILDLWISMCCIIASQSLLKSLLWDFSHMLEAVLA